MQPPKIGTTIGWVRSQGPGDAKDVVPMIFKGLCDRADEGRRGRDFKVRPASLGEGDYTCTVGSDDCEPLA